MAVQHLDEAQLGENPNVSSNSTILVEPTLHDNQAELKKLDNDSSNS